MKVTVQIKYSEATTHRLAFLKGCGYDGVELLLDGDVSDAETVRERVEGAGLYVSQTQLSRDDIEAGLRASSVLGVKWACLPIVINYDTDLVRGAIPLAEKYGVGIALENPATHDDITDTFCIYVDSFGSDLVGICYNIGHANLMGSDDFGIKRFDVDKAAALKRVGDRIKLLHVNDNHGDLDRRLCPTVPSAVCSVKWKDVLGALADIGFDGAFSLAVRLDLNGYCLEADYLEFCAGVSKTLLGGGAR